MKQAYVSVVMRWSAEIDVQQLERIDQVLSSCARAFEIVLVASPAESNGPIVAAIRSSTHLKSPVSVVVTWHNSSRDAAMAAGLSRAVGDFILEWDARPMDLSAEVLDRALSATDEGTEVVEIVPERSAWISRTFFRVANTFRPRSAPLEPSVGRLLSRRALDLTLGVGRSTPHRLAVADTGLPHHSLVEAIHQRADHAYGDRWGEAFAVLIQGTSAARMVPVLAAVGFALFALGDAAYALWVYFVHGKPPEGWTGLMVLTGLGLSVILALQGLLWERLDGLIRSNSVPRDATSNVIVVPPRQVPTNTET